MYLNHIQRIAFIVIFIKSLGCVYAWPWILNNPYPESESTENIYYSSFSEQPKSLDPALAYSINEYFFLSQTYEPLLEYDYLLRPYQLVPSTATQMPQLRYLDVQGNPLPENSSVTPAYSVYTINIKKGIFYQPHPALAKNEKGQYRYHHFSEDYLDDEEIEELSDFKYTGTRELLVDDYIYQIKRLANPRVSSPIYGLMSDYIVGFAEYGQTLPKVNQYIDLRRYPLKGIQKLDDYTFEITLKGMYTQFSFWFAMYFFVPLPWEADLFYAQPGMMDKNITLSWYPIGTGPFMLVKNNPNRSMVLQKNPNYREVYYPSNGSAQDRKLGYLDNAGKRLPLVEQAVFTLEKESIPRWNKFLQGYYDNSTIGSDSFDQVVHINQHGDAILSREMRKKRMYLTQTLQPTIYYMGFNMLDNVVGGTSERARKLRHAISIAVNYDEDIAIFYNGRGVVAQGPIPPGIFGYKNGKEGINPYVYQWVNGEAMRRPINDAKKLMIEAGYPGGIDPKTGHPLILNYDAYVSGGPGDKALFDWIRKQYAKIGIDLNVRATLYNRFQEKMRIGDTQIFSWGWGADYPDPENFLFQLYGGNSKVKFGGENAANYQNPEFDRLFNLMKNRKNDAQRQQLIDTMVDIVRRDAPWIWGINPEEFLLAQSWVSAVKPNTMTYGTLKYTAINVTERNKLRHSWNQPVFWPLGLLFLFLLILILPLIIAYHMKEKHPAERIKIR